MILVCFDFISYIQTGWKKKYFLNLAQILIMFNPSESQKISFLDKTKAAREERALEKKRDNAIIVVQSWIRGWLTRIKYERRILWVNEFILFVFLTSTGGLDDFEFVFIYFWFFFINISREELDNLLPSYNKELSNADIELRSSIDIYHAVSRYLSLFKEESPAYGERLERLCRYLLASLESENPKHSYIGVALNKEYSIAWIRHIKLLLYKCCVCMEKLKPGN